VTGEGTERIARDVERVLTEGEKVLAVASQSRIRSPLKPDSAVVTNRRLILYRPKLLGRMDMEDFLWQDVTEIRIRTEILGAVLTVTAQRREADGTVRARTGVVDGLVRAAALRLYAAAQQLEQEWREKNRIRQMEEERARSGGVFLHGAGAPSGAGAQASVDDRLAKLKSLHEKGLITDAEYEARKTQIIAEL